jgi:ketosteroid isomerase-like protein
MSRSLVDIAQDYSRAWAGHDLDAIVALHTDDSVFHLHDIAAAATGRKAVSDLIAALLAAVPDVSFDLKRVHFGAEHFVSEYVMSGIAEGKPFAIAGADVFTMRDGLVARKDSYLDWLAYQSQVGFDPAARFKALGY